jgi:hypothetical protein
MRFQILPDGEGFTVIWSGPDGTVISRIEGFATHQAAQGFIQDYMVKMALAFRPTN